MSRALTAFACPRCTYRTTDASPVMGSTVEGARPAEVGDLSLCLWCGAPLELMDGPPRWLSFAEIQGLPRLQFAELLVALCAIVTLRPSRVRYIRELGQR